MTGGIPPLISEKNPSEKVYETLFKRVCTQNEKFYKRFPGCIIIHIKKYCIFKIFVV